jgi:hypothetical protein
MVRQFQLRVRKHINEIQTVLTHLKEKKNMLKEIDCDESHSRKQKSSLLLQSGLQKLSHYNETLFERSFFSLALMRAPLFFWLHLSFKIKKTKTL